MEDKRYRIVRDIEVKPMTRLAYNKLRGWTLPVDENGDDKGFKIIDIQTKHISWLPEIEFNKLNKERI